MKYLYIDYILNAGKFETYYIFIYKYAYIYMYIHKHLPVCIQRLIPLSVMTWPNRASATTHYLHCTL